VTVLGKLLRDVWFLGAIAVLGVVAVAGLVLVLRHSSSGADARISYVPSTATPAVVPTPRLDQLFLDTRRKLDLDEIAAALAAYKSRSGGYPTTGGKTATLCHSASDPGCQLKSIDAAMPTGDAQYDYWYRSDGSTFVLITRLVTPAAATACPADLPAELAGHPLYCLGPKGGT
jgi:hypothetical protein